MSSHAKLSPSSGKRWATCPGSVAFIDKFRKVEKPNRYTAEGTVAHHIHERCLVTAKNADSFIGVVFTEEGFTFVVNEEMTNAVQQSLDYVREQVECAEFSGQTCQTIVEQKVSLKHHKIPGLDGGTADVILIFWDIETGKIVKIEVIDYKHGRGVKVDAADNFQALCYAAATAHMIKDKGKCAEIKITIAQPRLHHIDSWQISLDDLQDWENNELLPAARATLEPDAPLKVSEEGCRFCPAKAHCPQMLKKAEETLMSEFADFICVELEATTAKQKLQIMHNKKLIIDFLAAVEHYIFESLISGSDEFTSDYKLVNGRATRRFTANAFDEITSPLLDHLEENDLYERKPKGLGAIEKTLKSKLSDKKLFATIMEEITEKPDGKLTLVPVSDKRPPARANAETEFENYIETEEL